MQLPKGCGHHDIDGTKILTKKSEKNGSTTCQSLALGLFTPNPQNGNKKKQKNCKNPAIHMTLLIIISA
jgi:hypothetical protein